MSYRLIEIHTDNRYLEALDEAAASGMVLEASKIMQMDDRLHYRMLVTTGDAQELTDRLQSVLAGDEEYVILSSSVESLISPLRPTEKEEEKQHKRFLGISREELYEDISRGAQLDMNFLLLCFLSTIVAAIGLLEDNVAVVIGAMVIAPLLGPNICLAFGTTVGDIPLIIKAVKTNLAGLSLTLLIAVLLGVLWPYGLESPELLARTEAGFDQMVLAIVSGAAAILSLTSGVSAALVGVMVAVALLPPAVALGVMLGAGKLDLAIGAGLLLAINIVCVNLSAKLVFIFKGLGPRTWYEKKKVKRAWRWYLLFWIISLAGLILLVALRSKLPELEVM